MKLTQIKVQPIATFDQRVREHRSEMRRFILREFSWMLAIFFGISFGSSYLVVHLNLLGEPIFTLDWRLVGLAMGVAIAIPPFMLLKPETPDPSDVVADQMLRRAVGMDDSLSKE